MDILRPEVFHYALENTVDSVVITDMNSIIQYVNPAFTTITGFAAEEVMGQKPSIIRSQYTSDETYREMWSIILAGGWWRGEIINLKKSGEMWHSYLSISQIRDGSDTPFGYVGIARDVTEMKRLENKLREMSIEAIYMLSAAAEAKDEVTGSHIQRVRRFSESIAMELGMPLAEATEIGYSSMMHDVGKIHIPDAVLKKPEKLSSEEMEVMRQHPACGVAILGTKSFYQTARDIAGCHHERWDGTGYPAGRKGEDIPIAARIVTVADVFDALSTARPYKPAWDEEMAVAEIMKGRGTAFDPAVVDAFLVLYGKGIITDIRAQYPPD